MAGSGTAVVFCLHGCGYTGLTWAAVAAAVKDRYAPHCSHALKFYHSSLSGLLDQMHTVMPNAFQALALHCSRVSVRWTRLHIMAGMLEGY